MHCNWHCPVSKRTLRAWSSSDTKPEEGDIIFDRIERVEPAELFRELDHAFPVVLFAMQQSQLARYAAGVNVERYMQG